MAILLAAGLVAFLVALVLPALLLGPRAAPLVHGGCVLAGAAAVLAGALALGGGPEALTLPLGLPEVGTRLRLDALSGTFLLLFGFGSAAASLAAFGHSGHGAETGRVLAFQPAFLAGMLLVLLADDALAFLFGWEFMSIASWGLVMARRRQGETQAAGFVYLVMASGGAALLLLLFAILGRAAGGMAFEAMRAAELSAPLSGLILCLALAGCGSKAGLAPLHVWLPLAHPAAPSHVSGLMSGVMTKVAIYGFLRIAFDLLGPPVWWWGLPVLVAGAVTAFGGILSAMMETDLKRVLAASTIENVGVVFAALGLTLAFRAAGEEGAAALALTAALFHALNHMAMKGLLFLGAGAVLGATGQRQMDRLGGLIRGMPVAAGFMLLGSLAIAALPPLNGFASEWLLFQSVLLSPALPDWGLRLAVPAAGVALALAAALAAGCFVRAFGMVFLGRPRGPEAAGAAEADRPTLAAMALLAGFCGFAGLFPGLVIDLLAPAVHLATGAAMPPQSGRAWLSIVPVAEARSSYNGLLLALFVAGSALAAALILRRLPGAGLRRGPSWDCGFPGDDPLAQYSAASFAQPVRRVFGTPLLSARERVEMPPPLDPGPARFSASTSDPAWDFLYGPLGRLVTRAGAAANPLQFLAIRRYLGIVFGLLVALLAWVAAWG